MVERAAGEQGSWAPASAWATGPWAEGPPPAPVPAVSRTQDASSPDTPVAPRRRQPGDGPAHVVSPDATIYMAVHAWRPDTPSGRDVRLAAAAHWLPLVSHWIGPLALYLTAGRRSDHVRTEAAASANWELTVAIVLAVAAGLAMKVGLVGPILAIAVAGLSIGLHVVGAVIASRGGSFTYPLAIPFLR